MSKKLVSCQVGASVSKAGHVITLALKLLFSQSVVNYCSNLCCLTVTALCEESGGAVIHLSLT